MANQILQQDTSIEVKTGLPVAQRILVSVMMLGAFLGGAGLAMGIGAIPIKKLPKLPWQPQNIPMRITDLDLSVPVTSDLGITLKYQGWTGSLDNPVEFGVWSFPDNTETYDGSSPTALPLYVETYTEHAAINLTLSNSTAGFIVCIPSSREYVALTKGTSATESLFGIPTANAQTPFSIEPITQPYRYWVDRYGNTYADRGLRQKVNPGDCRTTATKSFSPSALTGGLLAGSFVNEIPEAPAVPVVPSDKEYLVEMPSTVHPFSLIFRRFMSTMALYDTNTNSFSAGSALQDTPTTSTLYMILASQGETHFPGNVFTLETDQGAIDLCIPDSDVPDFAWDNYDGSNGLHYFYDTNGTPYTDALLTQMATTKPCNELLANAYRPTDLTNGVLNAEVNHVSLDFRRHDVLLGGFSASSTTFNNSSELPFAGSTIPLSLTFEAFDGGVYTLPANTFTLESDLGTHTFCMPETVVSDEPDATNPVYYYDTTGTPYTDVLLTQRATTADCDDLLANAYIPTDLTNGVLNAEVDHVSLDFRRHDVLLGGFSASSTTFNNSSELPFAGSTIPLALTFEAFDGGVYTLPANIFSLESDLGTHTFCMPETVVSDEPDATNPVYYYDTNGTPYTDALLTQMATTAPCDELLADALVPLQVTNMSISAVIDTFSQDFGYDFVRNAQGMGTLYPLNNEWAQGETVPSTTADPLSLVMWQNGFEPMALPARVLNASFVGPDGAFNLPLCIPETLVPYGETIRYYFDARGTPYTDVLLTQMATIASCGELLADALVPLQVTNASISPSTGLDVDHGYDFVRNAQGMGTLYPANNEWAQGETVQGSLGDAFSLVMWQNGFDAATFPARTISATFVGPEGNYDFSLCVPETVVPSGSIARYYYDTAGIPYTDALLTHAIDCEQPVTGDTEPPVLISPFAGIYCGSVGCSTTISFQSDESAEAVVSWGTINPPSSVITSPEFATSHSYQITGLTFDTDYIYTIRLQDADGNMRLYGPFTFHTCDVGQLGCFSAGECTDGTALNTCNVDGYLCDGGTLVLNCTMCGYECQIGETCTAGGACTTNTNSSGGDTKPPTEHIEQVP
ncbi:MAG: hypothetical protein WCV86_02705 [Patescibacteria group bacterium]|jgi:hypothetical protein